MVDLKQLGYIETQAFAEGLIAGRVTELQREKYTVATERGEITAVLKGAFYYNVKAREEFPCVGDFVLLQYNEKGASRITRLLPRYSKFSRADFSGHAVGYAKTILEQVVAANFDYVFILSSLNWDFKVSRIMRYLTQARQSGVQPVIILTKADLTADIKTPLNDVREAAPKVPVHVVSNHTGVGLDELDVYLLPGKTIVFLGMSGVGKSSLLNALMNQDVMAVNAIREDDSRGRHTTTHRQLFMLPSGTMVIDTPGMRELGLFEADDGLSMGFADIEELFAHCRFTDCLHKAEPGCAVIAALTEGSLSSAHWESYLAQKHENKFVDDRTAQNKPLAAKGKQMKKNRGAKNE